MSLKLKIVTGILLVTLSLVGCGEVSESPGNQSQQNPPTDAAKVTIALPASPTLTLASDTPASATVSLPENTPTAGGTITVQEPTSTLVLPAATPSIWSDFCGSSTGSLATAQYLAFFSPEALAWSSDMVASGVVVEQLPSEWGGLMVEGEEFEDELRLIFTDYVVQIEGQVRGQKLDLIHLRVSGGTVDGCTIGGGFLPEIEIGQHLFLFLYNVAKIPQIDGTKPAFDTPTFGVQGATQGYWIVEPNGTVAPFLATDAKRLLPGMETSTTVEELVQQLEQSLLSGLPPEELSSSQIVLIEDAPVMTATPATGSQIQDESNCSE